MTEAAQAVTKEKKAPAVVTPVTMEDGRVVNFAGKRQMLKTVDETGMSVKFDFRNGKSLSYGLTPALIAQFAVHGASQKIGDEAAGVESLDDAILAIEDCIKRLEGGEWSATRATGDGFSGASFVIRAIAEVSGKSIEQVKAFLQKKLDDAKAKGEALSRQKLYESFRAPGSKTAAIIAKLEAEKAAKKPVVAGPSADDLLGDLESEAA